MPYHFHSLINLSRIPVNKGTNSRVGWTKYSDLYETVHPSFDLISLCLLTGAEREKGLLSLDLRYRHIVKNK